MAITKDDFNKIWASTSPLTPYSFSESQYKEGWNFIGSTPPSRQMWDFLQKNNDEKMRYLLQDFIPANVPLSGENFLTVLTSNDDLNNVTAIGTYIWTVGVGGKPANAPTNDINSNYCKMIIMCAQSFGYFYQLVFSHNGHIFKRRGRLDGGAYIFDPWKEFAYAEDVLPLSGGTMSGEIISVMENPTERIPLRIKYTGITSGVSPASNYSGVLVKAEDKDDKFLSSIVTYFWAGGGQGLRFINSFGDDIKTLEFLVDTNSSYSLRVIADNVCNLGSGAYRWKQLFAGTTTIATSDERLKDNIEVIPDEVLDAWGEVNWYQYQFKDSIAEKGETKARLHTGAIAQRIESVFESHGLDANRYGLLCYDEWDAVEEQKDEDGNVITEAREAGNRYSLRYEEALCMEAAYQRRRADRLEERIEALEKLLMNRTE